MPIFPSPPMPFSLNDKLCSPERCHETDAVEPVVCQPWSTRLSKMAQPNLDFMGKWSGGSRNPSSKWGNSNFRDSGLDLTDEWIASQTKKRTFFTNIRSSWGSSSQTSSHDVSSSEKVVSSPSWVVQKWDMTGFRVLLSGRLSKEQGGRRSITMSHFDCTLRGV